MKNIQIYGIKNCDTMKKAFAWLDTNNVAYNFHDYKKSGVDETVFQRAIDQHGWEAVINKRGTSWRTLPDSVKSTTSDQNAIKLALDNPSIIKRPLLYLDGDTYLGFDQLKKYCL